jgi:hypothetical protein
LSLRLPNRAAVVQDRNTADVYLTDLSKTPSSASATETSLRRSPNAGPYSHLSEPQARPHTHRGHRGEFDGPSGGRRPRPDRRVRRAGFLLPGRSLRKGSASGTLRNAPSRLTRATPGFTDLLGPARLEVSFSAKSEPDKADPIARAVRVLSAAAEPVD